MMPSLLSMPSTLLKKKLLDSGVTMLSRSSKTSRQGDFRRASLNMSRIAEIDPRLLSADLTYKVGMGLLRVANPFIRALTVKVLPLPGSPWSMIPALVVVNNQTWASLVDPPRLYGTSNCL